MARSSRPDSSEPPSAKHLLPVFYGTILICKGDTFKRRGRVAPIIISQNIFCCCGFTTNTTHGL